MWVLIVLSLTVGGPVITIPGWSSDGSCSAGGREMIQQFKEATGSNWAYRCVKPS